jgi:hypothetical protein
MAVEAKCRDVYYAANLRRCHEDAVESIWQTNVKTRNRVAWHCIALTSRSTPGWWQGYHKRGLGIVTSAAHDGLKGPAERDRGR